LHVLGMVMRSRDASTSGLKERPATAMGVALNDHRS
jgi:hypothetical protein